MTIYSALTVSDRASFALNYDVPHDFAGKGMF